MLSRLLLLLIAVLPAGIVRVQAQSLGDEIILSRLGDPVEVEIAVRDWQNIELNLVQVVNATQQQYEAFGLVYQPLLDTLSFNLVGPNLAGEVKILVSSREPANEPFLELLLALRWPDGSSLREYVLLFDPPLPAPQLSETESQPPAAAVAATAPVEPAAPTVLAPVSEPAPAAPQPAEPVPPPVIPPEPAPIPRIDAAPPIVQQAVQTPLQSAAVVETATATQARPREEAGRQDYRVQNGDTLWTIASQFQPAGIADNMYQFVVSLHDINRAAFIDGNITLLKADAELQIPSARDLAAINPASAQRVFDQRWLDSTRAALRAAEAEQPQLPVIEPVLDEPVADPVTVVQPDLELPLGTELPDLLEDAEPPLLTPSAAVVLAPAAEANAESEPLAPVIDESAVGAPVAADVPAIQVIPQQVPTGAVMVSTPSPAISVTEDEFLQANTALQQITDRAMAIRDLLQIRQQRLAEVEQQILALKNQLQAAETRAGELAQGLPQPADVTRQAVMLGLLVAVLLIALTATVLTALRWKREMQPKALIMAIQSRRR